MNHISRRSRGLDINLRIVPSRRCRTANGFINQPLAAFPLLSSPKLCFAKLLKWQWRLREKVPKRDKELNGRLGQRRRNICKHLLGSSSALSAWWWWELELGDIWRWRVRRSEVATTKGLMGRLAQIAPVWKHHLGFPLNKKEKQSSIRPEVVGTKGD